MLYYPDCCVFAQAKHCLVTVHPNDMSFNCCYHDVVLLLTQICLQDDYFLLMPLGKRRKYFYSRWKCTLGPLNQPQRTL